MTTVAAVASTYSTSKARLKELKRFPRSFGRLPSGRKESDEEAYQALQTNPEVDPIVKTTRRDF
jgi:hypothetical protein